MIEIRLLNFLKKELSVPVEMKQTDMYGKHIVIERVGGSGKFVKSAVFAIKSYGKSMYEACVLNEQVKSTMEQFCYERDITEVELNSDYNFTDKETKQYRYQSVYNITYY